MLKLIQMVRMGYPNRQGLGLIKVYCMYFYLAMINGFRLNRFDVPDLKITSKVWQLPSYFLIFQISYIKLRDWARTPLIRTLP